jgi:membrane-bound serine protease (ClpP class)
MTAFGIGLLIIGAVLVVAEAHAPGGVLGVTGGLALIAGGILAIIAAGGGAAVAIPVAVVLGAGAGGWVMVAKRSAASVRRRRIRSGAEGLCGSVGVVRRWTEPAGQVFVDGALWRARHEAISQFADEAPLNEGDPIVVERVSGLTLCVRRADEWEVLA